MTAPPTRHERAFRVRWAETGADGLLRPAALLDWMQEAAGEHAELLGVGMTGFAAAGLGWVLAHLRLAAERWPEPGERLVLRTWPAAREGLSFHRDFEVSPESGAAILRATTAWVVFDLARRRPARPGKLLAGFPYEGRRAFDDAGDPPAPPGTGAEETRFTARRSDLDVNRHVNNAAFVRWALDAAPDDLADSGRLAALTASFRGEALAGDPILVRSAPAAEGGGATLLQQILREHDGRELALLRVQWQRS